MIRLFKKNIYKKSLFVFFALLLIFLINSFTNKNEPIDLKVKLGRFLFYDTRLSFNNSKSCSSCHDPVFCFTDSYRTSGGATGFSVLRNAPSLINIRFQKSYTWADSSVNTLEKQMQFPMFNDNPVELGMKGNESTILSRLRNDPNYQKLFKKVFADETDPFTVNNLISCIASFERTFVSYQSAYDQYLSGNKNALSSSAIRGMKLFQSENLNCSKCHAGKDLGATKETDYFNTGLYNLNDEDSYPKEDQGLFEITHAENDKGKFRVPSLRNVFLTAPYTHNGTVNSLTEMIDIYARGGRNIKTGINAGDGRSNKNKSDLIKGFNISAEEKNDLISFLASLTDTSLLSNKKITNPFLNQN